METILAIIIGGLFAMGLYALLRRSLVKLIIGLMLIAQAINLLIFTSAGLTAGKPPIIDPANPASAAADPLPQALILTAIVISFGVLAFALVLVHRAYKTIGTDDLDRMKGSDE